jgi:uncharacterized protein YecT (DUF1311 family)
MDDQVIATLGVWALLGFLLQAPPGPPTAPVIAWPLLYEGKSTNELMWDNRMRQLVNTRVPAALSHDVLEGLIGPPDPVVVTDHRYVSASACVPHHCPMKAFFWFDTRTGIGLGAQFIAGIGVEPGRLRLGSNGLSGRQLPWRAREALIEWIRESKIGPEVVDFTARDGSVSLLDADDFWPKEKFSPAPWDPSFDCDHAAGMIEQTICGDSRLAKMDLALSRLVDNMRSGLATTVDRDQLARFQRDWVTKRNTDCAVAADVTACLEERYRAQETLLRNWTPSR